MSESREPFRNRRQHHRIQYPPGRRDNVELHVSSDSLILARLVDLSAGGLRCEFAAAERDRICRYQYLDRICVQATPTGGALSCSGVVKRLERRPRRRYVECAIEFSAVFSGFHAAALESGFAAGPVVLNQKQTRDFLSRLIRAARIRQPGARGAAVQSLAEGLREFHDIASELPQKDRWWFYYIVDSLKKSRRRVQKSVLAEYIRLCKQSLPKEGHVKSGPAPIE